MTGAEDTDESNTDGASKTPKPSKPASTATDELVGYVWFGIAVYLTFAFAMAAYLIRMGAIEEYGRVIHEFDPYFNLRATEYLYWNGWERFTKWFDHKSWYPLGRPVGTTIYPGMQVTSVWIKNHLLPEWSINDVCCFIPTWFGVIASIVTGLIAYEASIPANSSSTIVTFVGDLIKGKISKTVVPNFVGSRLPTSFFGLSSPALECFIATLGFMAIVPAHLMRSIGGGYDNESIAMTTMVATFYFWMKSIRTSDSYSFMFGFLTALAYFYMVATWGGYVFVVNLIGVHAASLVAMGRFRFEIWASYSIFYVVGTSLAMQVPVVGWTPLKSLEQLGPAAVFLTYQIIFISELLRKRLKLDRWQAWNLRIKIFVGAFVILVLGILFLAPKGYFGPLSSRVRGLFVKHTKTGNPLVDSVAEHQAASPKAYFQYLHHVCSLAPLGYMLLFVRLSDSTSFLLVWGAAAYYFSHKMVRLVLLTAPIGCVLAGILVGRLFAWSITQFFDQSMSSNQSTTFSETTSSHATASVSAKPDAPVAQSSGAGAGGGKRKSKKKPPGQSGGGAPMAPRSGGVNQSQSSFSGLIQIRDAFEAALKTKEGIMAKRAAALLFFFILYSLVVKFVPYCFALARQLSHPTVIQKARTRDGRTVVIDDYRNAYFWLRDNTPEDARIMAWWDYGYQIAGIANRTTIADGNTWNHEHIALLGKALTSELNEGYEISRHWADYILIWAGGGGDDLAKSPHLARIATSVYRDHCPDDPTCRAFGFVDRQGTPSAMMRRSLLYTLHSSGIRPDVVAPSDKFVEKYRSQYGKVRIWKILGVSEESKAWVADPANRKCDAPGSWFCPGQYPPGLSSILSRKKDFKQLEDFNRGGGGGGDAEYTKQYFNDLRDPETARRKIMEKAQQEGAQGKSSLSNDQHTRRAEMLYKSYEDTEQSTMMWEFIHNGNINAIQSLLKEEPWWAFLRSADGRGPMWWAFEKRNNEIVQYLMSLGVPHNDRDKEGLTPADLQTRA
ncbi:hypothetical protein ACA910_011319 [Epithemia clementina (nom. ined.)]